MLDTITITVVEAEVIAIEITDNAAVINPNKIDSTASGTSTHNHTGTPTKIKGIFIIPPSEIETYMIRPAHITNKTQLQAVPASMYHRDNRFKLANNPHQTPIKMPNRNHQITKIIRGTKITTTSVPETYSTPSATWWDKFYQAQRINNQILTKGVIILGRTLTLTHR